MVRIKRSLIQLFIILAAVSTLDMHAMKTLSEFNYDVASVLPTYIYRNIKYVILGRQARGKDHGTYDDFGGKKNEHENNPVVTAARKWDEEGLVHAITGLSDQEIENFIDIEKSNNTQCIIAYSEAQKTNAVVYITDVTQYKTKLLYDFYETRNKQTQLKNTEKDRIAIIKWTTLKDAIVKHTDTTKPLTVHVAILNPTTNTFERTLVTLKPFFVEKLRLYFLGKEYQEGADKKIRFYLE